MENHPLRTGRTAALLAGIGLAAGTLTGAQPAAADNGVPAYPGSVRTTQCMELTASASTTQVDGDFVESLIYSGAFAIGLAAAGLAIVGWRRRQW